jgi:predicted ATPase
MARIWISKITFNDSMEIDLEPNDIVIFVGANNVGKSESLKEIDKLLQSNNGTGKIIRHIEIEKEGDSNDLIDYIGSFSKKIYNANPEPTYQGFGFNIYEQNAKSYWDNYKTGLSELHKVFVNLLTTEARLGAANPPNNIALTTQAPTHPIHFLQRDDSLEVKFSDYFHQAFGTDLIVHRNAGNQVPLHVGEKPIISDGEDRVSVSYLEKLEKLVTLHTQGDGMRSFVGVLLNAFVSNHSTLLIDEPEAFLHPPQARLLGKMLAKDLPSDRQLFLATHSEDLLKGLLDSGATNIKVIRIRREEDINIIHQLDKNDIKDIWQDPLLRHSNILSGLFHSKVVICESESDCRFYSAILYSLYEKSSEMSPDVLFISCGGKHRMPTVVKSLKILDVPISVVADFDVLNDKNPIQSIIQKLRGDWAAIESDWKVVKDSIDAKKPEIETDELKSEIQQVFDDVDSPTFPREKLKTIKALLRKASPWSHAKQVGKTFIPSGDETKSFNSLIQKSNECGLFIVEQGELESFAKTVGNHGPKWVNEVLKKDLNNDPELEDARNFVQKLV